MALKEIFALFLRLDTGNASLVRAQIASLSRQIPVLYVLLIANTGALAYTHQDLAPPLLSTYIPLTMCLFAMGRTVMWWRTRDRPNSWTPRNTSPNRRRFDSLTLDIAAEVDDAGRYFEVSSLARSVRKLSQTVWLTAVIAVVVTAWAISLFSSGEPFAEAHVIFYIAVSVIGCVFCLIHIPPAALMACILIPVPFASFLLFQPTPALVGIGANFLFLAAAMLIVIAANYRNFADLVASRDTLEVKQRETQRLVDLNVRLANHDSLTALPNRRSFVCELEGRLGSGDDGGRFAVGLLDLDGFKPVNDLYGHATGDQLLVQVAERLRDVVGEAFIARLGGDEYGLIFDGEVGGEDLVSFGDRLCQALSLPFLVGEYVARVSASVGFASFPDAGRSAEKLFERADYALYHAKQNGRGHAVVFSIEHEREIKDVGRIEQSLRAADLDGEMSMVFQPIVDVGTSRTIGYEALARWKSPSLGDVAPPAFVRAAENSGLITVLTSVLLRKALSAAAEWPDDIFVSFNLSTYDIASPRAALDIVRIVEESGVSPGRIVFEVTETALMQNVECAGEALKLFKALGAQIALDDFGTGYSSLSYVQKLPLDRIKIDRSFIGDIRENRASSTIVRTIVDLCRNLDVGCVVEGVETEGQFQALSAMGCDTVQGYLFSKPVTAAELPESRTAAKMARVGA